MLKGSDVIGVPILLSDSDSSTEDHVRNWILDTDMSRIIGFLVAHGGWTGSARVLLWEDVAAINPRSMLAVCRVPVVRISSIMKVRQVLENQQSVIDAQIVTRSNENLGSISDVYFDSRTGMVQGFASVGGRYADAHAASIFVPVVRPFTLIDGMLLFDNAITRYIRQSNSLDPDKFPNGHDTDPPLHVATGLRTQRAVRSEDGFIIAATGQIVTDEIVEKVRSGGQEADLLAAVGLTA